MTEPIQAKVSDEDYQKVLDAFNNPQPYPEEMLEQVENHLTLKHEEMC